MAEKADRATLNRALKYLAAIKLRKAEYEEECESYYRQGHRPRYCIHGTNQWVDWDPICQGCEDGDPDPYRLALDMAKRDFADLGKRLAWLKSRPDHFRHTMPDDLFNNLISWVVEPTSKPISLWWAR